MPPFWTGGGRGESSWSVPGALSARRLVGRVLVGSVRACGSSTTRCRVAGRGPGPARAVAAGCRALGVWLGGGACDVPLPRAQPPEGPPGVMILCSPALECRLLDPAGPLLTGGCADQSTSVCHAERNVRGQLGDIGGTPARRALLYDRDGHKRPTSTPGWLVLGAGTDAFLTPGSGACVTDSSRVRRYRNAFAQCRRVHRVGNPSGSWLGLDLFIVISAVPLPAGSGIGVPGCW